MGCEGGPSTLIGRTLLVSSGRDSVSVDVSIPRRRSNLQLGCGWWLICEGKLGLVVGGGVWLVRKILARHGEEEPQREGTAFSLPH